MFTITKSQLLELSATRLAEFFSRIAQFLRTHVDGIQDAIPDLAAFARYQYGLAKKSGLRTEREIVHYILNEVEKTC